MRILIGNAPGYEKKYHFFEKSRATFWKMLTHPGKSVAICLHYFVSIEKT